MFNFFSKKSQEKEKLFFSTDIHSHVVPGIDDGAPSVERSLELVESMKSWGLEKIIVTPHVTQDTFENTPEIINAAYADLLDGVQQAGIGIDMDHSAEYRIDEMFVEQFEAGMVRRLHGDYLLVENSYIQEPYNLNQILFEISMKGFTPILAHPERYMYYYEKRNRYDELHNNGILFQVNLLSLAGYYGKEPKKIAEMLIEKDYVDFLGTDLHRRAHVEAIDKYLESKDYLRHREKLQGRILNDTLRGPSPK
ncbi:MAG: hypothetical protein K2L73_00640 [Muribaculaceae bacterium]|nr:hypothetical protein [Muribaculaceae bacterium]